MITNENNDQDEVIPLAFFEPRTGYMTQREVLIRDLTWKKFPVLSDGFVCLVDVMGDDSCVVQAARVSYGRDCREISRKAEIVQKTLVWLFREGHYKEVLEKNWEKYHFRAEEFEPIPDDDSWLQKHIYLAECVADDEIRKADRTLLRYLMRHRHTTPFEMCEMKFLVRVPMDTWRQWIRHRMASVNEYSTRYTEAIDSMDKTPPDQWRLQATNNKQGSSGFLTSWPEEMKPHGESLMTAGQYLSHSEASFHLRARELYEKRLKFGIAKEQARKDLPLSTYTEVYWKIDLHNLLHFLGLRMDSHAQKEIRDYATIIGEQIVKPLFPEVWSAFEDYRLNAMTLTAIEVQIIGELRDVFPMTEFEFKKQSLDPDWQKEKCRERDECIEKLKRLGLIR